MFPQLARFTDLSLLLLRLMVGLVFITSGYSHLKDPEARSKSIETAKSSLKTLLNSTSTRIHLLTR